MTWTMQYVVAIGAGAAPVPSLRGTGFVVAPGKVVTARHVLIPPDSKSKAPFDDLCISVDGRSWQWGVSCAWHGGDALDVAVLDVPAQQTAPLSPLAIFDTDRIDDGQVWGAQGYPIVRADTPSDTREQAKGTACLCEGFSATLLLDGDVPPEIWSGLSGAAVVIAGRVRGVVRGVPLGWSNRRITATPASRFVHDPAFRAAVGVPTASAAVDDRVKRMKADIAKELKDRDRLLELLGKSLECDATQLVDTMIGTLRAGATVKLLADVYGRLASDPPGDRTALRRVLFRVLPFAADWRSSLASCCALGDDGPDVVELSYRSDTVAEIIMAGIHNRGCEFRVVDGAEPFGVGVVQQPAATQTTIFQSKRVLLEAVVEQLAQQLGVGGLSVEEKLINVDVELERRRRTTGPDRLRYYFLFRDAASGPGGNADGLWSLALETLRGDQGLPHLVLVRMRGQLTREESIVQAHVKSILKP